MPGLTYDLWSYQATLLLPPNLQNTSIALEQLKGQCHEIFLLLVFFINQFPPSLRVSHWDRFEFFRKFAVRHVTGTGSGLLGGIPRVVQISALTLKGPL